MTLTLSTAAAIALVVAVGLIGTVSLVVAGIAIASSRLPGAQFDEHQAEADALAEHVDQALALVGDQPTQAFPAVDAPTQPLAPVDDASVPSRRVVLIYGSGQNRCAREVGP